VQIFGQFCLRLVFHLYVIFDWRGLLDRLFFHLGLQFRFNLLRLSAVNFTFKFDLLDDGLLGAFLKGGFNSLDFTHNIINWWRLKLLVLRLFRRKGLVCGQLQQGVFGFGFGFLLRLDELITGLNILFGHSRLNVEVSRLSWFVTSFFVVRLVLLDLLGLNLRAILYLRFGMGHWVKDHLLKGPAPLLSLGWFLG